MWAVAPLDTASGFGCGPSRNCCSYAARLLLIALQDRYAGILEAIDELSAAETADEVRCAALRHAWHRQRGLPGEGSANRLQASLAYAHYACLLASVGCSTAS